jgi:hypothetical protein
MPYETAAVRMKRVSRSFEIIFAVRSSNSRNGVLAKRRPSGQQWPNSVR